MKERDKQMSRAGGRRNNWSETTLLGGKSVRAECRWRYSRPTPRRHKAPCETVATERNVL
ncbi:hypothetical protein EYF80_004678 [Liparis tanakae]|uniref:Uncharacterized protein n=1 Tax=Liparis tanakae TaxID=230148 RepID=A0A4Z2J560_9TELE|nr:hypothetical protein EYF80_004678 [Liparis tanakae]